jgi:uncharacterized DUF497 family protein/predicted DNA binding CopG/RHH family protein
VSKSHEFDWDEHNEQHLAKHGIRPSEAEDILAGNHILLEYQMERNEQRWVAVGATRTGRILSIVFAVRGEAIRPITGWVADNRDSGSIYRGVGGRVSMARAKMSQVVIPKFSSEAEEAAWWDRHRSEIEAEIRQRMKQKRPMTLDGLLRGEKPSRPVTLRIAKEDLETARRLAARKGVGYQTYIKMLLREALAEHGSQETSDRSGRGEETLGRRHVEFDAHKVVRQTAVEFGTRDGSRASFLARRTAKVPVRVSFKDNRKVTGRPRSETEKD